MVCTHIRSNIVPRAHQKIGLMVLLAYLKFCWRVLFFAGVVLGPKRGVLLAYASKILLAVRQKIPALYFIRTLLQLPYLVLYCDVAEP